MRAPKYVLSSIHTSSKNYKSNWKDKVLIRETLTMGVTDNEALIHWTCTITWEEWIQD